MLIYHIKPTNFTTTIQHTETYTNTPIVDLLYYGYVLSYILYVLF